MRAPAFIIACISVLACQARPSGVADAGSQSSSVGPAVDAGVLPDAGSSGTQGPPPDAGADAGTPPDLDAGPPPPPVDAGPLPLRHSPIFDENQLAGGSGWHLDTPTTQLAAWSDRTSALPGEQVNIHAGAASATDATWQLWRVGYYGGKGGRLVLSGGTVHVPVWSATAMDPATGMVSTSWPTVFSVSVPASAVTGAYLVKLTSSLGDTYAMFVVREPQPAATILYKISTNTYQAYNDWGGTSLYANSRSDWQPWHAYAVSFDRPYQNFGAGELFSMDRGFIFFAEAQGYDLAYVSDADLDADPGLVARRRMLTMGAHTEYWTATMRQALVDAIDAGINVAFLGANSVYWQVRFADAGRRTMIGYKEFASRDPDMSADPAHVTTRWRDPPLNQPENALIGAMFGTWLWSAAPMIVADPSSWLWAGANVQAGAMIPGIYGDESDCRFDNGAQPAGVQVVANGFAENHGALFGFGETTLYPTAAGGMVFNAGSITFSAALSNAGRWDPRVQQLAANLFSRFNADGPVPAPLAPMHLPSGIAPPSYRAGVQVSTVTTALNAPAAVAVAANGDAIVADGDRIVRVTPAGVIIPVAGGAPGAQDGPAANATFRGPRGVAVAADGTIYVSDTLNNRIRVIANGQVTTLAGTDEGFSDGANAMFAQPMSIALTPSGTLLVADAWNQRVREVTLQGVASTWAGTGAEGIADGPGADAQLEFPMGLTLMPNGDAIIVEPMTGVLRRVAATPDHTVSVVAGSVGTNGWDDGGFDSAEVFDTLSVAARPNGEILLIDEATARIRVVTATDVETLAGGQVGGTVDGPGPVAGFGGPRALAVAPDGSVLVVDAREHALRRLTLP